MSDDFGYGEPDEGPYERPRDGKIDEAKATLLAQYFPPDGKNVYYGRQLEVALEGIYFH